jgi:hypothetical protein
MSYYKIVKDKILFSDRRMDPIQVVVVAVKIKKPPYQAETF